MRAGIQNSSNYERSNIFKAASINHSKIFKKSVKKTILDIINNNKNQSLGQKTAIMKDHDDHDEMALMVMEMERLHF